MKTAEQTRAALRAACEQTAAELAAAELALAHWTEQVSVLRRRAAELQADSAAAERQALAEEQMALAQLLDESAAAWRQRTAQQAAQTQLADELAALPARDATLAEAIRTIEDTKARQSTLDQFAEEIRDLLQQTLAAQLAALEQRVAPYRALQQQLEQLRGAAGPTLTLACAVEDGQLWHWITPWPADGHDDDAQAGAAALLAVLSGLGRDGRWTVDDIDRSARQGRLVYSVLGSFAGSSDEAIAAAAELLNAALQEHGVTVAIRPIAPELWQLPEAPTAPPIPAIVEPTEEEEEEDGDPPAVVGNSWFSANDLRSWTRKSSKRMNPMQRRMRTLVIRLLGRGHISDRGVNPAGLIDGLPEPQAAALRGDIALLRERNLLIVGNGTDAEAVTLNPARLEEYRTLILRDPGEVWLARE